VDEAKVHTFCELNEITHRYTDIEPMLLAQHPDIVHICTPPDTHCDLTIRSLEHGAWVYCDKPYVRLAGATGSY